MKKIITFNTITFTCFDSCTGRGFFRPEFLQAVNQLLRRSGREGWFVQARTAEQARTGYRGLYEGFQGQREKGSSSGRDFSRPEQGSKDLQSTRHQILVKECFLIYRSFKTHSY